MEQLNKKEKRRQRILKRNDLIKDMYQRLSSQRIGNVRKFSEEAINSMIADKFFLSEKTIDNIICNRINYKQDKTKEV